MTLRKGSVVIADSVKAGQTEILHVKDVAADFRKAEHFELEIDFTDSVLAIHSYSQCPHVYLELSIVPTVEIKELHELKSMTYA
jgi:hypothetical protein